MKITEVRVNLQGEEALKAFVSITLDDEFVVRGLKVIQGEKGRFVAMPARRRGDGTFQDVAHPINREMRKYLETCVMQAYEEALANSHYGRDGHRDGHEDVGDPLEV
jgi:stage V sporulation protein G